PVLHVVMLAPVATEDGIQARDPAVALPGAQVVAEEEIMRGGAFAEQQPVAALAGADPLAQVRAQASDAGAVADQDHWRCRSHTVGIRVAAEARLDAALARGVIAEQTAAQLRRAIRAKLTAQQQLHLPSGGQAGDAVPAMRQRP